MTSWNEIRKAATAFSKRWKNAYDEKSQAQSFLKEFFAVFGVDAVTVATFEHRVKFADGAQGYADCFWPGKILVEMKSRGRDLDAAFQQAMDYVRSMTGGTGFQPVHGANGQDARSPSALPRAIVVSDFARIRFYDLARDGALTEFPLKDLRKYVTLFGFMIGADEGGGLREQDPVNRRAAEKMARLHDAMKAVGYTGHALEVYLVRLLFCLFAEDTGIFKPNQFSDFVRLRTAPDGHDLAPQLALLFQTLNAERRLANLDESLAAFPYVNGGLFAETLPIAAFSADMRRALLDCGALDWSKISPAIFGAMFQGVMDETARHDLGAHYTSEENILKVIRPLFLDGLRAEFETITGGRPSPTAATGGSRLSRPHDDGRDKRVPPGGRGATALPARRRAELLAFHEKIAALTFLDPACGCGNFLLVAYRELRRLEMDVLEEIYRDEPNLVLDVSEFCKVRVSQFHGIEIEPFAAEIAKVALWLMDHLCNLEVADRFGQYFARIPIRDAPHIVCANALTTDWPRTDYIMGNPPFLGRMQKNPERQAEIARFFDCKDIDYVACWYAKAAEMGGSQLVATENMDAINCVPPTSPVRCAFVSTNSITQGEQVAPLWRTLGRHGVEIDFAWRTFKWRNEAKGVAAVHCVIIGFHAKSPAEGAETGRAVSMKSPSATGGARLSRPGEADATSASLPAARDWPPYQADESSATSAFSAGDKTLCASASLRETPKTKTKTIYDGGGAHGVRALPAAHINGYLMDAPDVFIESRPKPLCDVPAITMGNMPLDGGHLIIEAEDLPAFVDAAAARDWPPYHADAAASVGASVPLARGHAGRVTLPPWIKRLTGSREYIQGLPRWCLWLKDVPPGDLRRMPPVMARVAKCREWRLASRSADTRKHAATPALFREQKNPRTAIIIPSVSSEKRDYIPMGFIDDSVIVTNLAFIVPDATLYHLGVLMSRMHMAWVRAVAGRLEMRYRYSKDIVYNNFVWPEIVRSEELGVRSEEGDGGRGATALPGRRDGRAGSPLPAASERPGRAVSMKPPLGDAAARDWPPYRTDEASADSATSAGDKTLCASASLRDKIAGAAQAVLDARAAHPGATLADLYDPLTMPPDLVKAHAHLDALVDRAYGFGGGRGATARPGGGASSRPITDADRVALLFRLYAAGRFR